MDTFSDVLESVGEEGDESEDVGGDAADEEDQLEYLEWSTARPLAGGQGHEGEGE